MAKHLGIIWCRKRPSGPRTVLPKGPQCRGWAPRWEVVRPFCSTAYHPTPIVAMTTSTAIGLDSRNKDLSWNWWKKLVCCGLDLIKDNWQESTPCSGYSSGNNCWASSPWQSRAVIQARHLTATGGEGWKQGRRGAERDVGQGCPTLLRSSQSSPASQAITGEALQGRCTLRSQEAVLLRINVP